MSRVMNHVINHRSWREILGTLDNRSCDVLATLGQHLSAFRPTSGFERCIRFHSIQ